MFDKLYKKIVEEEEEDMDIFKASTPEEGERRKHQLSDINSNEWVLKFTDRDDITYNQEDDSYDVHGEVNLDDLSLTKIPIKFNVVDKDFSCCMNYLTSLENCPTIVKGNFSCQYNNLTSLAGGPVDVFGQYNCSENLITSYDGFPKHVGEHFLIPSKPFFLDKKIIKSKTKVDGVVIEWSLRSEQ